jgi:1-acyl-sn-glycerol-3-phosphate acyltransferase
MTEPIPTLAPKTPHGLLERIANALLKLIRWRVVGTEPQIPKFVIIVAPHTSNWDLPLGLICGFAMGLLRRWPYGFMAKDVVFRWPVAGLMRRIGGLPIDRSRPHDIVPQMAAIFQARDRFLLAITPEGTRKRTGHWKSGFYHIAHAVGVPIIPVSFDYAKRECRLGDPLVPTGDLDRDLTVIQQFYQGATAKRPERMGEIRFRDSGLEESSKR